MKKENRKLRVRLAHLLGRHDRWSRNTPEWNEAVTLARALRAKGQALTKADHVAWKTATGNLIAAPAARYIKERFEAPSFARTLFNLEPLRSGRLSSSSPNLTYHPGAS